MKRNQIRIVSSDLEDASYGICEDGEEGLGGCATLSVNDLSLHYGSQPAFENVSAHFKPCAITSVIGPSGCGKTSFLYSLNRLIDLFDSARVEGTIRFGRLEISNPDCDIVALRRRMGMIFQQPRPFPFSIRKNFHLPLREHGMKDSGERDAVMEDALRSVGLWPEVKDRLSTSASNLSGGQQQRLCIARTLALKPEVLLLDEPCSALDPIAAGVVEELICSLRGRFTVIVVTHNLSQARRISDDAAVFWIRDGVGTLVEHGPANQIFEQPEQEITAAYVSGLRG